MKTPVFAVIIPARYASTRFPGKPLAMLRDKEVILHVVERAAMAADLVAVATDDRRIADCVINAGYTAIMTRPDHQSGTDRIYEALNKMHTQPDVVINVQGDEPFIAPEQIQQLMQIFIDHPDTEIATLARKAEPDTPASYLLDPNLVKVVLSRDSHALYFSRSLIPAVKNLPVTEWPSHTSYYTHVGIYAYQSDVLRQITKLSVSPLENAESLEQLRWLSNGYRIRVGLTTFHNIGIDTPADLAQAESAAMKSR